MKAAFIFFIQMADLGFMLFLYHATPDEHGVPLGSRMEHLSSRDGSVDPARVERAYIRFVANTPSSFCPELVYARQVVALGQESGGLSFEAAARASVGAGTALSSLGAPPGVPIEFQLVLPDSMPLREASRLHAKASELGLDCQVVSNTGRNRP